MDDDELKEDQMISDEGIKRRPFPFLFWLFVLALIMLGISLSRSWYSSQLEHYREKTPFFDVTNRQFSLFLWENPRFMRANVSSKEAYLPGFQYLEKVTPYPELASSPVEAPPDIIFLYHTWDRLIGSEISPKVIPPEEFASFLENSPDWSPKYWPEAPKGYVELVESLPTTKLTNLDTLPEDVLPRSVRLAFIGWTNYTKEGEAINEMTPSYAQLRSFLEKNSTFARSYWVNILKSSDPNYLYTLTYENPTDEEVVARDQMAPFLRVALFNYIQAQKPSS